MRNRSFGSFRVLFVMAFAASTAWAEPTSQIHPNSPEAVAILKKAQQPVDAKASLDANLPAANIRNIPICDAFDWVRHVADTNLVINYNELAKVGLRLDTPTTLVREDVTARQAFEALLKPFEGAEFRASEEIIYVSTKDDLDRLWELRKRDFDEQTRKALDVRMPVRELDSPYGPYLGLDVSLKKSLTTIGRLSQVKLTLDAAGLESRGIDPEATVFLRLKNATLRDALLTTMWLTGRGSDLDVLAKDGEIRVVPRALAATRP